MASLAYWANPLLFSIILIVILAIIACMVFIPTSNRTLVFAAMLILYIFAIPLCFLGYEVLRQKIPAQPGVYRGGNNNMISPMMTYAPPSIPNNVFDIDITGIR